MNKTVTEQEKRRTAFVPALILVVATAVLNLVVAAALVNLLDVSDDFRALQFGPVLFATVVAMAGCVIVLAAMRHRWPENADRRFMTTALVVGLLSCIAPLSMLGADADTVDGWSRAAVLSLLPLHLIPTGAAALMPRVTQTHEES